LVRFVQFVDARRDQEVIRYQRFVHPSWTANTAIVPGTLLRDLVLFQE
jgi:hypothetical protein